MQFSDEDGTDFCSNRGLLHWLQLLDLLNTVRTVYGNQDRLQVHLGGRILIEPNVPMNLWATFGDNLKWHEKYPHLWQPP